MQNIVDAFNAVEAEIARLKKVPGTGQVRMALLAARRYLLMAHRKAEKLPPVARRSR